ncbi:NAD(P)/FAD-dependent oxidoreductase [Pseudomonas sp. 210_17 TE3656]
MTNSARIIVIGGGIIGTTIAANLAVEGHQVTLLEKETIGGNGATKFSGALFRLYDPDREIAKLSRLSIEMMEETRVGQVFAQSLKRSGILYACEKTQLNYDSINECINTYSDALYPLELISAQKAYELSCGCYSADNVRTVLYEAKGGFGDIRKAARDLAFMVKSAGNTVMEHTQVDSFSTTASGVTVRCANVVLEADYVVLAAGAWSGDLCEFLPIDTKSIPLASLSTAHEIPLPIIDTKTGTHLIPLNRGFYQAGSKIRVSAKNPEALDYDQKLIAPDILARLGGSKINHRADDVVSVLKGFDSYTVDGRPVLDFVDANHRCIAATGFCGIGYKIALAVAQNVKNTLLSGRSQGRPVLGQGSAVYGLARFPEVDLVQ